MASCCAKNRGHSPYPVASRLKYCKSFFFHRQETFVNPVSSIKSANFIMLQKDHCPLALPSLHVLKIWKRFLNKPENLMATKEKGDLQCSACVPQTHTCIMLCPLPCAIVSSPFLWSAPTLLLLSWCPWWCMLWSTVVLPNGGWWVVIPPWSTCWWKAERMWRMVHKLRNNRRHQVSWTMWPCMCYQHRGRWHDPWLWSSVARFGGMGMGNGATSNGVWTNMVWNNLRKYSGFSMVKCNLKFDPATV